MHQWKDNRRFATPEDVDEFVATLEAYERGELSTAAFQSFRLLRGVYGQRQADQHMLRVKIPQGILAGAQLRVAADVAERHANGRCHITTRQNLQFHFIAMDDVEDALRRFESVGITTREACGNAVRNITACHHAGVGRNEPFDVSPYAEGLTRALLRTPLAQALPRKFKIAFSCATDDCARADIHDIGLRPVVDGGRRGFQIIVGGGLAVSPQLAWSYTDFLPESELVRFVRAVLTVFDRHGDRQHRHRARLKYLIRRIGIDTFRQHVEAARTAIANLPPLDLPDAGNQPSLAGGRPRLAAATTPPGAGFADWSVTNVEPQRQAGYCIVTALVPRGDLDARQLRGLAELVDELGDGELRLTANQNAALRWIALDDRAAVHTRLAMLGLAGAHPGGAHDPVSCPGADSCKLAVTASRALASTVASAFAATDSPARAWSVKISGCPNSCGHHHVADIGLHGAVRKAGGRLVPVYQLHVGGGADGSGTRFGTAVVKIPARRVVEAIRRLERLYEAQRRPDESPHQFLRRLDASVARAALADLADTARLADDDHIDLGSDAPFQVVIAEGECAS